jgi:prepilin-type N-terminal cleavage/methylation domain-containing protein
MVANYTQENGNAVGRAFQPVDHGRRRLSRRSQVSRSHPPLPIHQRAFTLVELLVVIAIIGTLVALLLPAVQAAREAARRSQCVNSIRNLGLAALNYESARRTMPISMGYVDPGEAPPGTAQPCAGWLLAILPYMEEQSLYDQFQQGGGFDGSYRASICRAPQPGFGLGSIKNGISVPELMKRQLTLHQCPSDDSVRQLSNKQFQWVGCDVALTSYKGVLGDTWLGEADGSTFNNDGSPYPSGRYTEPGPPFLPSQRDCHRDTRCEGIFFRHTFQRPVRLAKIQDGTSKTLMIGEDVPRYNRHSTAFYSNGDWCSCNIPLNYGFQVPNPDEFSLVWWDAQGFRSRHSGGANFASVDCAVRFVSDSIDNVIYRVSCTRNGREALSEGL